MMLHTELRRCLVIPQAGDHFTGGSPFPFGEVEVLLHSGLDAVANGVRLCTFGQLFGDGIELLLQGVCVWREALRPFCCLSYAGSDGSRVQAVEHRVRILCTHFKRIRSVEAKRCLGTTCPIDDSIRLGIGDFACPPPAN